MPEKEFFEPLHKMEVHHRITFNRNNPAFLYSHNPATTYERTIKRRIHDRGRGPK